MYLSSTAHQSHRRSRLSHHTPGHLGYIAHYYSENHPQFHKLKEKMI
jgi:hypothetical protein